MRARALSLSLFQGAQCVAVCCSVLQCVAVCCIVLQCAVISLSFRARSRALESALSLVHPLTLSLSLFYSCSCCLILSLTRPFALLLCCPIALLLSLSHSLTLSHLPLLSDSVAHSLFCLFALSLSLSHSLSLSLSHTLTRVLGL